MSEISMRENVGLLAYSPLAFGYLSGKYRNDQMPKNSRMGLYADIWGRYRKEKAYGYTAIITSFLRRKICH